MAEEEYGAVRDALVAQGRVAKGRGRGGAVRLVAGEEVAAAAGRGQPAEAGAEAGQAAGDGFFSGDGAAAKRKPRKVGRKSRAEAAEGRGGRSVVSYQHKDKRKNNPHVGLVSPESDAVESKTEWAYDPHIDPELRFNVGRSEVERLIDDALAEDDPAAMRSALQELKRRSAPYLAWTGKAERTSFEVDLVSLHVHERIDPRTILRAVEKEATKPEDERTGKQLGLFEPPFEQLPLRDAIDFYKHERGWANRLVAGDSLLVMNSLLQKEGLAGQVQMIYIDPPYGIKYGSNFQPFVDRRDVKDRKDEDLTQEPEMVKAFRDTWELGIHSYLTYLRDRLLLARELLHERGSVFVQIGDDNLHVVRNLLDDVFGADNFVAVVAFKATDPLGQAGLAKVYDYIIWYARDRSQYRFRGLFRPRDILDDSEYRFVDVPGVDVADRRDHVVQQHVYRRRNATSSGYTESCIFDISLNGRVFKPAGRKSWSSNRAGMERVSRANRLFVLGRDPYYKQFHRDFPLSQYENCWTDKPAARGKQYVVETAEKFVERCMLMCTDPGDVVLDPTCGSGTTAIIAEKWGRRWISCDTSRVAVTLAKQRLMTTTFDYYELKYPHEGLKGGFIYKTVPHVTLVYQ